MAKTTKAERAAGAALDAAAAAAKDAKRLSRTLPKKDAKRLLSVADEAKDVSQASKKKVARNPRKVEKKAAAATARLEKAADKAEGKLADAKAAAAKKQKAAAKKTAAKRALIKKAAAKKGADAGPHLAKAAGDDPAVAAVEVVESVLEPTPVEVAAPSVAPKTEPAEDLASLTIVQLRGRARAAGHTGFSRSNKAQLVALLS